MKAKFEADFDERHDDWCDDKIKAGERRILQAKWLKEAWDEFFADGGQEQVTKAFKRCGMLNAIDGSEDSEIHVQGIDNYDIGVSSVEEAGELDDSDNDESSTDDEEEVPSSDGSESDDREELEEKEENSEIHVRKGSVSSGKKRSGHQKNPLRATKKKKAKASSGKAMNKKK